MPRGSLLPRPPAKRCGSSDPRGRPANSGMSSETEATKHAAFGWRPSRPAGWIDMTPGARYRALRRRGDSRITPPALLQNTPGKFRGLAPQADDQPRPAAIGQHRTHFGALGGNPANRAIRQHIHDPPATARGLPHHIGQRVRLTRGRYDPRLYDAVVADGGDGRQKLEPLAVITVEIGYVGGDGRARQSENRGGPAERKPQHHAAIKGGN